MTAERLPALLDRIENEMRQLDVWSAAPPDTRAMASEMPFSHDTMSLDVWLQWVLIPRLRAIIDAGAPLPGNSDITSYADVVLEEKKYDTLRACLKSIDDTLNQ